MLFTDGGATQGTIQNARLVSAFNAQWNRIAAAQRPRMFIFGVGDDANLPLLKQLGNANGVFEWARSSEPDRLQNSTVHSEDRPVSDLVAAPFCDACREHRHGLSAGSRGVRRLGTGLGWSIQESGAVGNLHCDGPARGTKPFDHGNRAASCRIAGSRHASADMGQGARGRSPRKNRPER